VAAEAALAPPPATTEDNTFLPTPTNPITLFKSYVPALVASPFAPYVLCRTCSPTPLGWVC
jgi:hypothetical protein